MLEDEAFDDETFDDEASDDEAFDDEAIDDEGVCNVTRVTFEGTVNICTIHVN